MTDGPNHFEVAVCADADVAVVTPKQVARDGDGVAVVVAEDALALDRETRVEPRREPPRDRLLPHPPLRPRARSKSAGGEGQNSNEGKSLIGRPKPRGWVCVWVCVGVCV